MDGNLTIFFFGAVANHKVIDRRRSSAGRWYSQFTGYPIRTLLTPLLQNK